MSKKGFIEPREEVRQAGMQEVKVGKHELGKSLEELDVRKAMGPGEVSNCALKECTGSPDQKCPQVRWLSR